MDHYSLNKMLQARSRQPCALSRLASQRRGPQHMKPGVRVSRNAEVRTSVSFRTSTPCSGPRIRTDSRGKTRVFKIASSRTARRYR